MKAYLSVKKSFDRFDSFFSEQTLRYIESIAELQWATGEDLTAQSIAAEIDPETDVYVTACGSPKLDGKILDAAPKIKLLVHLGACADSCVSDEMRDKGIRVISGCDDIARSVAEGCIAYMLTAQRRIPQYSNNFKYRHIGKGLGTNAGILDKTIGIVGYGPVSEQLIRLLQPFHCKLKLYSSEPICECLAALGCEQASLEEIFSGCDIISIHTPYHGHARLTFGADHFKLIKPGALFMNTACGRMVDEAALTEELRDGRFRAFLDVYEQEPPAPENELYTLPNVYMMPHQAGPTSDRYGVIARELLRQASDLLSGKTSASEQLR